MKQLWFYSKQNCGFTLIEMVYQELTGELSKLNLRETDLKLTSEPPLLLDTENNEMHKVAPRVQNEIHLNFSPGDLKVSSHWIIPYSL